MAGLPLVTLHDCRHTFASFAIAAGMNAKTLSTIMGHADIANTYWYLEATPELLRDISVAAEALVAKEMP